MKAKDILNRLPVGPAAATEAKPRAPSALIPIVGEIGEIHRGAVAELKELKARRLITWELPPSQIDPGPYRDRDQRFIDDEAFTDLVDSIRREGQLQPVLVRSQAGQPPFELVVGLRRVKACERLGIPVQAKEIEADDRSAILSMIAENELREDISALERSRQLKAVLDSGLLNQSEIAGVLGRHKSLVSRLLALAEIPPALLDAIGDPRVIPLRLGYTMAQLCRMPTALDAMLAEAERLRHQEGPLSPLQRLELLLAAVEKAAAKNSSPSETRTAVSHRRGRPPGAKPPARQVYTRNGGKPLVSVTGHGSRAGAVVHVAPELGADFLEALLQWAVARLRETGHEVELGPTTPPTPKG